MRPTILSSLSMNRCPPKRGHVHPATAMPVYARRRTRPTDVATGQSTPHSDTATRPAGSLPTTLIIASVTFNCQLPPAIDRVCTERRVGAEMSPDGQFPALKFPTRCDTFVHMVQWYAPVRSDPIHRVYLVECTGKPHECGHYEPRSFARFGRLKRVQITPDLKWLCDGTYDDPSR